MSRNFIKGILFLSIIAIMGCIKENKVNSFYVGTYTDGESKGIYSLSIDENGKFSTPKFKAKAEIRRFLRLVIIETLLFQ